MRNNMKVLIIFLACMIVLAVTALLLQGKSHRECWFCSNHNFFERGVEFACSDDEKLRQTALEYIMRSAHEGDVTADMFLAELYADKLPEGIVPVDVDAMNCLKDTVSVDTVKAGEYLDKVSQLYRKDVERGGKIDMVRAYDLAEIYLSPSFAGKGDDSAEKAKQNGIEWLKIAAHGGNIEAILKLASAAEQKDRYGAAMQWYIKAAELKPDFKYALRIGDGYLYGKGTDIDYKKALKWYQKAHDQVLEAAKKIKPAEREHLLSILAVRMEIANRKLERAGGKNPVTVDYMLSGNSIHYIINVLDNGPDSKGIVSVGEVKQEEKGIKASISPNVTLPEKSQREKDGFQSMNQGMNWVLRQWAATRHGVSRHFVFRLVSPR